MKTFDAESMACRSRIMRWHCRTPFGRVAILATLLLAMFTVHASGQYTGGDGTLGNPYQISDVASLQQLSQTQADWAGKYFVMTADIDISASTNWNVGDHDGDVGTATEPMGFISIGSSAVPFTGSLDGQGYQILGLFINRPTADYVGLFGYLGSGSEVKAVGLQEFAVAGNDYVGSLSGYADGAAVGVCSVVNTVVDGATNVGGLVGCNTGTSVISNCFVAGSVDGAEHVGGVIGLNTGESATLRDSYSQAAVTSGNYAGSVVARNSSGIVEGCVYDETQAGGVAGIGIDDSSEETYNLITSLFGTTDFAATYGWSFGLTLTAPWADGSDALRPYIHDQPVATSIRMDTYSTETATLFGIIPTGSVRTVASYGIVWSENPEFTNATATVAGNLDGENFSVTVSGLAPNSAYYYKAYIVDSQGNTMYGAKESFAKGFYSGGSGAANDPFLISDTSDLKYLSEHGNDGGVLHWTQVRHFSQTADIDMLASTNWNIGDHDSDGGTADEPMGFSPIGSSSFYFKGTYKGNRYKIRNLYINRPQANYIGLFGYVYDGATLDGIDIVDCSVVGLSYTGPLCGYIGYSTIRRCSASGTAGVASSASYVGGLVGRVYYSCSVFNCYSSVDVTNLNGNYTGGLFGESRCYMYDCYASGTVKGGSYTGGLIGHHYYYQLWRCYFSGAVSGGENTGGLIGRVYSSGLIYYSYVSGLVLGGSDSGAMVGHNEATVTGSYWDRDTVGTARPFGTDIMNQTPPYHSTSESVLLSSHTAWGFNEFEWQMQDGLTRPYLSQQRIAVMNRKPSVRMEASNWVTLEPGYVYHIGDSNAATVVTVTDYGYLWKKDEVPTIHDGTKVGGNQSASLAESNGVAISAVTLVEADGLVTNADYYARAYAIDSEGNVAYGDTVSFRTEALPPSVANYADAGRVVTNETAGKIDLVGFLDISGNMYGESITEYGFIYSETTFSPTNAGFNPNGAGLTTVSSTNDLAGDAFTLTAGGLTRYQVYYYTAYAINATGLTGYSDVLTIGVYYSGGSGSAASPFILQTPVGLRFLSEQGNAAGVEHWTETKYFDQQADIDMSDSTNWNVGDHDSDGGTTNEPMGFVPIGSSGSRFQGYYAGNGHRISGIYINRPTTDYVGLFGYLYRPDNQYRTVTDVNIVDCDMVGRGTVGALAGHVYGVQLTQCRTAGTVAGNGNYVGGLVGYLSSYSDINDCSSIVDVSNSGDETGGLIGRCQWYFYDSHANGTVTSTGARTGGLIGYLSSYSVYRCHASGAVLGAQYTGGLVGYAQSGYFYDSYSAGYVSGGEDSGGLVGYNNATLNDCYWDRDTSGYSAGIGEDIAAQAPVGHDTTNLLLQAAYVGFPFGSGANAWRIQDTLSRPYLEKQQVTLMNRRAKVYLQAERWVVFDPAYVYHAGDGNAATTNTVVEYGFLYKKDTVPTISDGTRAGGNQSASLAESAGAEIATVTLVQTNGLVADATYYMRTYAIDSDTNVFYGDTVMFNTEAMPPVIVTQAPTDRRITGTNGAAALNALINSIGSLEDETITEHGFVYGTVEFDPTVDGFDPVATGLTVIASSDALTSNAYSANVSALSATQTYYFAAHATSSSGLQGYGSVVVLRFFYGGGDGTVAIPFRLNAADHLRALSEQGDDAGISHWGSGKFFEMTANIDMSDSTNWNVGDHDGDGGTSNEAMGFVPIGNGSSQFKGNFDGNGYIISDLYINRPVTDYVGLFGNCNRYGSTLRVLDDIVLRDCDITGRSYVGALVGYAYGARPSRCHSSGIVIGNGSYVGGLIGCTSSYADMRDCSSSVDVSNSGSDTGGLVGSSQWQIYDSHASGSVTSEGARTGGLVGYQNNYSLYRCFAVGAVIGTNYVGGFAGESSAGSAIYASYASGYVRGDTYTAGFIGSCNSTLQNSYWDRATSGQSTGVGWASASQTATSMSSADAVKKSTYSGFPFTSDSWGIFDTVSRPHQEFQEVAVMNGQVATYSEGAVYMNRASICVPDDGDSSTTNCAVEYGIMYLEEAVPVASSTGAVRVVQETTTLNEGEYYEISARQLSGLSENVVHYLRAYAITGEGRLYYGDTVRFIPELVAPVVETLDPLIATPDLIRVEGKVLSKGSDDAGVTIVQYGFIYSQTAFTDPSDLVNPGTNAEDGETNGVYSIEFNDVTEDATYYYAAFAKNSSGATGYGEVRQFIPRFYSGGSGTSVDPFLMGDSRDFAYLSIFAPVYSPTHWDSGIYFEQIADVDMSDTSTLDSGDHDADSGTPDEPMGFSPIGTDSGNPFSATYDGAGYKLSAMTINRPGSSNPVGTFGYLSGAEIRNVTLVRTAVTGNGDVGAIAGIAGSSAQVLNCSVVGNITGTSRVGGLVGKNSSSLIKNCFSSAIVAGDNEAGGIVGMNDDSEVSNSYSIGHVSGNTAGGIAGVSENASTLAASYVSGITAGSSLAGTLIGSNSINSTVTSCYWDSDICISNTAFGADLNNQSATAITSDQAKSQATFTGFSFGTSDSSPWRIVGGSSRPFLYWQDIIASAGRALLVDYNKADCQVYSFNLNQASDITIAGRGYLVKQGTPPSVISVVPVVTSDGIIGSSETGLTIAEDNGNTFVGSSDAVDSESTYFGRAYVIGSDGMVYYGDLSIFTTAPEETVTLTVNTNALSEYNGEALLTGTLSDSMEYDVTINLAYSGTATRNSDFSAPAAITITAGNLAGTGTVAGIDNRVDAPDKTIVVDVSSVVFAIESGTQQVALVLSDDDLTPDMSLTNLTVVYDGSARTPTATTDPAGLTVVYTFDGSASSVTDVGSYVVTAMVDEVGYAAVPITSTFTITPRPITLAAASASKYVGDADPAFAATVTVGTLGSGDTVADVSGTMTREAGETIGAFYDLFLGTGSKAGNYTITFAVDNNAFTILAPVSIVQVGPLAVTMSEDGAPTNWIAPTVSAVNGVGTLTWTVATAATGGTATVSGTGSSPTTFTYEPATNFNGTDSFAVRVSDPGGSTTTIVVNVTIDPVNDAPVIVDSGYVAVDTIGWIGLLDDPRGITIAPSGQIYVTDRGQDAIYVWDADGKFLRNWGSAGSGDGELDAPHDIAISSNDTIYVVDENNERVQIFDADGTYLDQFGSYGSGDGEFNKPRGIAIDDDGNVYVADMKNDRIQVFEADGSYLRQWSAGSVPHDIVINGTNVYVAGGNWGSRAVSHYDLNGNLISSWGTTEGSGDGEFSNPRGIAVDAAGKVYVADMNNDRIQVFTSDGTYIRQWGVQGNSADELNNPHDIAISAAGYVYIVDQYNSRVQVFNTNGVHQRSFGDKDLRGGSKLGDPYWLTFDEAGNLYVSDTDLEVVHRYDADCNYLGFFGYYDQSGEGNGVFDDPSGMSIDAAGTLYVADKYNDRIQVIDRTGQYLRQWGTEGSSDGQLNNPQSVFIHSNGRVYVADTYNDRIQVFTTDGTYVTQWGSYGSGDGELDDPYGITADSSGDIYVVDYYNHRVQVFDPDGAYLRQWGSSGSGDGEFRYPRGIGINTNDMLFVADRSNDRIQYFSTNGTFLGKIGDSEGTGLGQFNDPSDVAFSPAGAMYVCDSYNDRIVRIGGEPWDQVTMSEDGFPAAFSLRLTAHDVDGDTPIWTVHTGADHGTVSVPLPNERDVTDVNYDPEANWFGTDTFTIQAADAFGAADTIDIDVIVEPVNEAIEIVQTGPLQVTMSEDGVPTNWVAPTVSATDTSGSWTWQVTTPARIGTATVSGNNSSPDIFNYVPLADYNGTDSFEVQVSDGVFEDTITVEVTVVPMNDPPEILTGDYSINDSYGWAGIIDKPEGVAVAPSGDVYVTERYGERIMSWDSSGVLTGIWGGYGSGDGQFRDPHDVAIGTNGMIYVVDTDSYRIQIFDADGTYLDQFGSNGSGDGEFDKPRGIAADLNGNIYVVDMNNTRVQVFDAAGSYLRQWSAGVKPHDIAVKGTVAYVVDGDSSNPQVVRYDLNGNVQGSWGTAGTGNSQFDYPRGIAVDADGNVYVVDMRNERIQVFEADGSYLRQWGTEGSGDGQFDKPHDIAVSSAGLVYVTDYDDDCIHVFDTDGLFLRRMGMMDSHGSRALDSPTYGAMGPDGTMYFADKYDDVIYRYDRDGDYLGFWGDFEDSGSGARQFNDPYGLAFDAAGMLYVADNDNERIQVLDAKGNFLREWGTEGSGDNQFENPYGIAHHDGKIYVADGELDRIQIFTTDGTFVSKFGVTGSGDGELNEPYGIAVDTNGDIYVPDSENDRVQVFDPDGTYLRQWGSYGSGEGQFDDPRGIAIHPLGQVYVLEYGNDRVQHFDKDGTYRGVYSFTNSPVGALDDPYGITMGTHGRLFICDTDNDRIVQLGRDETGSVEVTMSEDGSPTDFSLQLIAVDIDGDTPQWQVLTQAVNGVASVPAGAADEIAVAHEPALDWNGTDSFIIEAYDADGGSDTIAVQVTVVPVADALKIYQTGPLSVTMSEDGSPIPWAAPTLTALSDMGSLTWSLATNPTNGLATVSGTNSSPDIFTYAPSTNANGSDSFDVQVTDGIDTNTITVDVTIDPVVDPAIVTLLELSQTYDGTARVVTTETVPTGLGVNITYDGSAVSPINAGSYVVTGTVDDVVFSGMTTGTLVVTRTDAPVALPAGDISTNGFRAHWTSVSNADHYVIDVSASSNFVDYVTGYSNRDVGDVDNALISGLADDTWYWYRLRTCSSNGAQSLNSNIIGVPTGQDTPWVTISNLSQTASTGIQELPLNLIFAGDGLVYSVTSDTPAVVSAEIDTDTGVLRLTYTGVAGTATITVTARQIATDYEIVYSFVVTIIDIPSYGVGSLQSSAMEVFQSVTITNTASLDAKGVRVTISGLDDPSYVINSTSVDGAGNPVIDYPHSLATGEVVEIKVVYDRNYGIAYTEGRKATITAHLILRPLQSLPPDDADAREVAGIWPCEDGSQVVAFRTEVGSEYMIQYRATDLDEWKNVYPTITALGTVTYWVDSGQPVTESRPCDVSTRFYQILNLSDCPDGAVAALTAPWPADGVEITDRTPTFRWESVAGAKFYRLWINRDGTNCFKKWYSATTSASPDLELAGGNYEWWVMPWTDAANRGPWSAVAEFSIPVHVPGQATLLSPSGTLGMSKPEFTWEAVTDSSWYCLWISRSDRGIYKKWVCGVTNFTVTDKLYVGEYKWWIRTWNPDGYGPWSSASQFDIGLPHPVAPSGVQDPAPAVLRWDDAGSSGATWYQLWVNREGAKYWQTWIKQSGTTDIGGSERTCPLPVLPAGNYEWWIRAYHPTGLSRWSAGEPFSIKTP